MGKALKEIIRYFNDRDERLFDKLRLGAVPPCFESPRQYKLWRAANLRTPQKTSTICVDCTVVYQQEMMALGRCQHPDAIPGERQDRRRI